MKQKPGPELPAEIPSTEQAVVLSRVHCLRHLGMSYRLWNLRNGLFSWSHPIFLNNRSTHSWFSVRANEDGSAQLNKSKAQSSCPPTR